MDEAHRAQNAEGDICILGEMQRVGKNSDIGKVR
jgi:hypothetical protein